jgi:hypothetical protein
MKFLYSYLRIQYNIGDKYLFDKEIKLIYNNKKQAIKYLKSIVYNFEDWKFNYREKFIAIESYETKIPRNTNFLLLP